MSHLGAYMDDTSGGDETTAWLQPMARSWEEVQEDASGALKQTQLTEQRARKKAAQAQQASQTGGVIEKSVIRYLYVVVDMSWNMQQNDLKVRIAETASITRCSPPFVALALTRRSLCSSLSICTYVVIQPNRKAVTLELLESFIVEFFDQNPLSHLGFILSSNRLAQHVTDLSGNPSSQIAALRAAMDKYGGGELSLQNALELARSKLASVPPYGSREVLLLVGALATVDPGDIHETISACAQANITCSVICMAAEMYVCSLLATTTGGQT